MRKLRLGAEIITLLAFFGAAGYAAWRFATSPPSAVPATSPTASAPLTPFFDVGKMLSLIKTTPPAPAAAAWRPARLSNRWKHIVVHHSATAQGTLAAFDRAHRRRGMEHGIAYHFLIGNGQGMPDGMVLPTKRWQEQLDGGHLRGEKLNQKALGICLVGDFTINPPSAKQVAALKGLLLFLLEITTVPMERISGHKEMPGQTSVCPGFLPVTLLRQNLRAAPAAPLAHEKAIE